MAFQQCGVAFIILILFYVNFISAEDIKVFLIFDSTVSADIDYIVSYVYKIDNIKLEKKKVTISEEYLSDLFKEQQMKKDDTVFAYLPNADFDMINRLAVQYGIYVWNAVAYANATCYSNIVFGYDISESTLLTIDKRINELSNLIIAYDSTESVFLGSMVSNLKKVLDFSRLAPIISYDFPSSKSNQLFTKIDGYLKSHPTVVEVTILNYYSDTELITNWKNYLSTSPTQKINLINMPTVPRDYLLQSADAKGSMILSENGELPSDLIKEISDAQIPPLSASLANKDFSLSSIQLYEMCRLYYIIGKEKLDDFSSGNDILFYAYRNNQYFTIYNNTAGDQTIEISLNEGNRLIGTIDYGRIDAGGVVVDNNRYKPVVGISYVYVDGLPKEYICNFLKSNTFKKPDTINILLLSYRNFFSQDETIRELTKSNKKIGYAFRAAKKSINDEGLIMNKKVEVICIDLSVGMEQVMKEYITYKNHFTLIGIFSTASVEDGESMVKMMESNNITDYTYIRLTPGIINYCKKNVIPGLNIITMWRFVIQEFSKVIKTKRLFIIYSDSTFSTTAMETVMTISKAYDSFDEIIYEQMKAVNEEQALNICTKVLSQCSERNGLPEGCLVVNLVDTIYQKILYQYYHSIVDDMEKYPVISVLLDENIINDQWENYDGSYVIGYYFDQLNTPESNSFKQELRDMKLNENEHITSTMGYSYITVKQLLYALKLARSLDHDRINNMIIYTASMLGPGGYVEWNSQGTSSTQLHIGKVNSTSEKIDIILSSSYVMYSNAYLGVDKKCEWLKGASKSYPSYTLMFIDLVDSYLQDYFYYYALYNNVIVDYINLKDGINNRLLKISTKTFNTIDEMKVYVEKNSDNKDLLAFFGTTTNEQRDALEPILKKHKKFLFSIHPSEGMRCYENIIQVGRVPNHYAFASIATVWQYSNNKILVIVMCNNKFCHDVGESLAITAYTMKDINVFRYYINDTLTFDKVADLLKLIETDRMIIFTVLGFETTDFIKTLHGKNMDGGKYTVVSLDVLVEWVDPEIWEEEAFFVSYTKESQTNIENQNFILDFTKRFGENDKLLNEHTLNIYTSIMILNKALAKVKDNTFEELKRQIKGLVLKLPVGEIKVRDDLVCSNSYVLVRIANGKYKIMLKTINPMAISAFLAYRKDGDTSKCETAESYNELLNINLVINSNEESILMLLNLYLVNYNERGYNIALTKYYCDDFNPENITSIVITSCSVRKQQKFLVENPDLLLISIIDKSGGSCDNRIIELGSFPNQKIIPYIGYILTHYNTNIMLITTTETSENELNMIKDTISSLGGTLKKHTVVNESDTDSLEDTITDFITSYRLYIREGGVFLNYLQNKKSFELLFQIYQMIFKNFFPSVEEAAKVFPIFSWDINILNDIGPLRSKRQYSLASCYSDENTATKIYNMGINMFGEGYSIPKVETRAIIAYELLVDEYSETTDFNNKGIYNYLNNHILVTSFGVTNMSKIDTSIPFTYVVLQKDKEGISTVVSNMTISWEAEPYRHYFNREFYKICSKLSETGEEVTFDSIKFYFLISFSGEFSYSSSGLLLSYLSAVDFVNDNYNGIHNKMILPIVKNIDSNNEKARKYILKAVNDTGNRVIFGLTNSDMRKYVLDDLHDNELLLFYPYSFEGYECSENVIYLRSPFTDYITIISYFYLSKHSFKNVVVLYSDTSRDYENAKNLQYFLQMKSINVEAMIRLPTVNYKMNFVVNIIKSKLKTGLIVSMLEGQAEKDLFIEMRKENLDLKAYTVVSFNTKLTEVEDKFWELFDGHYFVETLKQENFKNQEVYDIAHKKYTFIDKELTSSGLLSVIVAAKALNSISFTNNTNSEENDDEVFIPYSFEDLLNAVHNVNLSDIIDKTRITTNNQISLLIYLVRVHYYSNNNSYSLETITHLEEYNSINPYTTKYNSDGNLYYCEWKVDNKTVRGSKIQRNSKKIALLYSITGDNRKYQLQSLDIVMAMIKSLNKKDPLNGTFLDYKVYDTSNIDNLKSIAEQLVNDEDVIMVLGCSNTECKNIISHEFINRKSNKMLWYPSIFEGQECDRYVYFTGLVPSLFTKPLSTFINQITIEKKIYLLGNNDKTNEIIHKVLKKSFEVLYKIVGDETVESDKGSTYPYADKIVESYIQSGCIIILLLDDVTTVDFINYFDELVTKKYHLLLLKDIKLKFHIITIRSDRDLIDSLTLSGNINIYLCGSYFDEINSNCEFRKNINHYFGEIINGNELAHSSYLALEYWANAVSKLGDDYTNNELLKNQLIKSSINSCTGITMMFKNNHLSLPFFIMQILKDKNNDKYILKKVYSQTRILEPLAYSWDIPETNGLVCDFTASVDTGVLVPTITIAVALSISGTFRDTDKYVTNVFELILDALNTNNGLLNKRITVQSYDIQSSDSICFELLYNYLKLVNEGVIFTSASDGCISLLSPLLEEKDILLFHVGYTGGEKCYRNVFYMLKEPSFVGRIIDYLIEPTKIETLHYCILTANGDDGLKYGSYITNYLKFVGGIVDYSSSSLALPEEGATDDISPIVDDIVKGLITATPTYGCYILFVADSVLHYQVDKLLDKYTKESNNRDKYTFVSLNTASNAAFRNVKSFYSVQTYFTNLDNPENEKMKEEILSVTTFVTEAMYTAYISSEIFINAAKKVKSIQGKVLRKELYKLSYKSPSGGILTMGNDNYINQYMMYGKMIENDDNYGFELIMKSATVLESVVYKDWINDAKYVCKLNSDIIYTKYRETSITIGILTSFRGKYNTTERSVARGIIQAIDEINNSGGIIGKKIEMLIRDAESDINRYVYYAEEFCRLDEVSVVFGGGGSSLISHELDEVFERKKKLFFSNSLALTESCPKFIMTTQINTEQLMKSAWKYLLSNTNHLYIIQDDEIFSSQFSRSMLLLSEMTKLKSHVYNLSSLNDTYIPDDFDVDSLGKDSLIILSVIEENNIKAFSWLCRQSINMTKTNVVAISLDRYLMEYIPRECVAGSYMLTAFIKEMGLETSDAMTYKSTSKSFIEKMNSRYGKNSIITSATENGYLSVQLWSNIITSITKSFDNEKIRENLYGYSSIGPSGKIEMSTDGFANRVIYLVKVSKDLSLSIVDYASQPEIAYAWNDIYPENEGYKCDWTIETSSSSSSRLLKENNKRLKQKSLKLIFFHDTSVTRSVEINSMLMEYTLIQEINRNGGINDIFLIPEFIFGNSVDEFSNLTSKYVDDDEVVSFFGCSSDNCKINAQSVVDKTQKLWMSYSLTYGSSCSGNHLESGSTISQKFQSVQRYLNSTIPDLKCLIFIGDDSKLMESYYKVIFYYIKQNYKKYQHTIVKVIIKSDKIDSSIDSAFKVIQQKKDEYNRVALLYFLEGEMNNKFISKYISDNLNSREILIIIMNYVKSDYKNELFNVLYGSYVVSSFSSSISTSLAQSFITTTQTEIGIKKDVSEKIESIKDTIMLWEEIYKKASKDSKQVIPPLRYIQLSAVGTEIKSPSGSVKVEESLYVSRNSYIFEINKDARFIQIFPSRGSEYVFNAEPYPEGLPEECKFGKTQLFYQYNSVILGIAYSLFGISLTLSISSVVFVKIHEKQLVIKTLGRSHNYGLAIALIILSLSSIPIYQYPSLSNGICVLRVVLLSVGIKSVISVMLASETKLFKRNKTNNTIKKTRITIKRVFIFWLVLMAIEVFVLLLWFFIDPNEYISTYYSSLSGYFSDIYIRECSISTPFVIVELITDFLPALVLLVISNRNRNLSNTFHDTICLFISSVVIIVLGIIIVLLDFNINKDPDSVLLLRSMGINLTVIIMILLLYGTKVISVYIDDDAQNVTSSGSAGIKGCSSLAPSVKSSSISSHGTLSSMMFASNKTNTFTTQSKLISKMKQTNR